MYCPVDVRDARLRPYKFRKNDHRPKYGVPIILRAKPYIILLVRYVSICIYIYIYTHVCVYYIYVYRGEAGGSPEDVGTFSLSLSLSDRYMHILSFLHTDGGVGMRDVNLHCIASSEDVVTLKMVLAYRWEGGGDVNVHRTASSEDVVTLKILLRSNSCYVEDVVALKKLSRSRCCYVEDVVTLKMSLRSRCCHVQSSFMDVKRKKAHVHFVHSSLMDYDIFMSIKRSLKLKKKKTILMGKATLIPSGELT